MNIKHRGLNKAKSSLFAKTNKTDKSRKNHQENKQGTNTNRNDKEKHEYKCSKRFKKIIRECI